jgi:hypothetical protein
VPGQRVVEGGLLAHDGSMRLPIHLACNKNTPFSVLRSLLDVDEGKASIGTTAILSASTLFYASDSDNEVLERDVSM